MTSTETTSNLAQQAGATADHSRFVRWVRRRWPELLYRLDSGLPARSDMLQWIEQERQDLPLAVVMRRLRHCVMARVAVSDVEEGGSVSDVCRVMTELAEVCLDAAVREGRAALDALHGPLLDAQGRPVEFWVVGMGKLGARELNVSSDIDLIYVYEEDGQTTGPRPLNAQEYFAQLARQLQTLIGDITDDGQVFRMDLALRPHGKSGPIAVSLSMLEDYLQSQGREWERFAWLKSRVVAPRQSIDSGRARALAAPVTSFVYRKYLDYGVFEGLRQLHRRVREEAQRRAAGRPERANDVKLSRGGIREIEFVVQLLQVVRGGQFPEIRTRSTLKALDRLAMLGLMKHETAQALAKAYDLFRRVEHRAQYLDDQQTHLVPSQDEDLKWMARSLGYPEPHPDCRFLSHLGEVRELVAGEFDALLHEGKPSDRRCSSCEDPPMDIDSEAFLTGLPEVLAERVRQWSASGRLRTLRDEGRGRLARLLRRAIEVAQGAQCPPVAVERFADWLEPLLRRENYIALLEERKEVLVRLLRLLGLARWPMRYLMRHPMVIDELADDRLLSVRFDAKAFRADLELRHEAWARSSEALEESLLDTLRLAHHAEVFRTLVRDVEGYVSVEEVADDLSLLADTVVQTALDWSWPHLKQAHRQDPRLAVVAYGKLGGKELGYGSDLDLVFVYDGEDEADPDAAAMAYGAWVRKVIHWLTLTTAAGGLFEIDTALRPNGNSGLLVTSLRSFENYQVGRGSNTAWTWEHQAITRARFCAGHPQLLEPVEQVRRQVLMADRDPAALRQEVQAMRQKMSEAHPVPPDWFDVKHSPGGMLDIEFCVQTLVLTHSATHPQLAEDLGNIALLQIAEQKGLLPEGLGLEASVAYRELRRAQHRARLDEQPTHFDPESFEACRDAGLRLWAAVIGPCP